MPTTARPMSRPKPAPTRELQRGERSVSELVEATGFLQGTLSKHLQTLHDASFVKRRRDGQFVYYALADERVLALCEQMCGRIEDDADAARQILRRRTR